jgi:transcriptional regulator with GAF, ATPase, and Fis domain
LAHRLHELSGRGLLIPVNCGALPRDLVASELFGHVRGAFSGACSARAGLFVAAQGGTLFLDELCELPIDVQPALLRVLQDGRVRPVGAEHETAVDVRIIAATNKEPELAVRAGQFRADLYARVSGAVLRLTPLRERRQHVLSIAASIAEEAALAVRFSADALEALLIWDFPYNVRELKSLLLAQRGIPSAQPVTLDLLRYARPDITAHFERRRAGNVDRAAAPPASQSETGASHDLAAARDVRRKGALRDATDLARLEAALQRHDGHLTKAAQEAMISRQRAQRLLQRPTARRPG